MYQIALFIHILGVLCLMGGHTLIHASLEAMRRAQQVERVRDWIAIAAGLDTFMPLFTLAVLLPGIYMAWTAWGLTRVGFLGRLFPVALTDTTGRLAFASFHALSLPCFLSFVLGCGRQAPGDRKVLRPGFGPQGCWRPCLS